MCNKISFVKMEVDVNIFQNKAKKFIGLHYKDFTSYTNISLKGAHGSIFTIATTSISKKAMKKPLLKEQVI